MVVQGCHAEDPLTRRFEDADLNDVGQHDCHEQTTDDDGKKLRLGEDRQAGHGTTEGQGTRVAHKNLRGGRVPPQEAGERTDESGAENCQVQRVTRRIAGRTVHVRLRARLNTLEVGDEGVGTEDEDRHTRRQAVQAVRQVGGVRPGRDDEVRPDEVEDDTDGHAGEPESQRRRTGEGDLQRAREFTELVGPDQSAAREQGGDGDLADDLARGVQTQRALTHDLDAVIKETNGSQAHKEEGQQDARPRGASTCDERTNQPCDHGRQDDHNAAHRRRSTLRQVLRRPILADELAVVMQHQETDEQRCTHHRQRHRDDERSDKTNHRVIPFSRRMSATCHECEPKEPFTRTTAPSAANSRARRAASAGSSATTRLVTALAPSR